MLRCLDVAKQVIHIGQQVSLGTFFGLLILNYLGEHKALKNKTQILLLAFIDAGPHSMKATLLDVCGIYKIV